jgi:hypothetical protein
MNREQEFNDILDECLERMLIRGETVEQCLARYPELADELKPLLQASLFAKEALDIRPRSEFRERARYQMQAALREMEEKRQRRFSLFSWQPRWATVAITVLVVLVLGGGSTVAAAGNSLPDQTLYPVKLATEKVRIAVTFSKLGKAELYAKLADKRVNEIIAMVEKGKIEKMERTTERLNEQLIAMTEVVRSEEAPAALIAASEPTEEAAAPLSQEPPEGPVMMAPATPAPPEEGTETPAWQARERGPETVQPAPSIVPAPAPAEAGESKRGAERTEGGWNVEEREELRRIIAQYAEKHPEELRALLQSVPESARPALRRAIEASDIEYEKLLQYLEDSEEEDD